MSPYETQDQSPLQDLTKTLKLSTPIMYLLAAFAIGTSKHRDLNGGFKKGHNS